MRCEAAPEQISAWIDGELRASDAEAIAAHVKGCAACAAIAEDFRGMGQRLAAIGREPAPADLARRIVQRLDGEDAAPLQIRRRSDWVLFARQAAALVLVAGLSAGASWQWTRTVDVRQRLEHDVVGAHVRSLLQDSQIQVASSDSHTVRPWFTGRLEFAPNVKDLTGDGFPLVGGRVDFVDGHRAAALVYKRRLHVVNVFMWPATGPETTPVRSVDVNGYNAATWTGNGMRYWAVSDLNATELLQLAGLL